MNAKELILGAINAGIATVNIYLAALYRGDSFLEAGNIMTGPVGNKLTDLMKGNIFTGDGFKSVPQALYNIALANAIQAGTIEIKKNDKKQFIITSTNKDTDGSVLAFLEKFPVTDGIKKSAAFKMSEGNDDADDLIQKLEIEDVDASEILRITEELANLAHQGETMKVMGQIFGVNQGVKTDAYDFWNRIKSVESYVKKRGGEKFADFNFVEFINSSQEEQDSISESFGEESSSNIYPSDVNILKIITHTHNFKDQLKALGLMSNAYMHQSFRYKGTDAMIKAMTTQYATNFPGFVAGRNQYKEIDRMVSGVMTKAYIKGSPDKGFFEYNIGSYTQEGVAIEPMFRLNHTATTNSHTGASSVQDDKNNNTGTEKFVNWFENVFINDIKTKGDLKNNPFIQDIRKDSKKSKLFKEYINVLKLPVNYSQNPTDVQAAAYTLYREAVNKLKGVVDSNGNNVLHMFSMYMLIKNGYGQSADSFTHLFTDIFTDPSYGIGHELFKDFNKYLPTIAELSEGSFELKVQGKKVLATINGVITFDFEQALAQHPTILGRVAKDPGGVKVTEESLLIKEQRAEAEAEAEAEYGGDEEVEHGDVDPAEYAEELAMAREQAALANEALADIEGDEKPAFNRVFYARMTRNDDKRVSRMQIVAAPLKAYVDLTKLEKKKANDNDLAKLGIVGVDTNSSEGVLGYKGVVLEEISFNSRVSTKAKINKTEKAVNDILDKVIPNFQTVLQVGEKSVPVTYDANGNVDGNNNLNLNMFKKMGIFEVIKMFETHGDLSQNTNLDDFLYDIRVNMSNTSIVECD